MEQKMDLKGMDARIKAIRRSAEELQALSAQFPALYRNTARILASVKMLEINLSDLADQGLLP
ncbi:MAG: hypothetical protein AB1512_26960 [Thermodesulfobacteriota bacterium]